MVYLCLPINSMVMASMALNVTGDGTGKSVLSCVPLKPIQSPGKHKRTWPINSWAQHRSLAAMARGMGGSKKTSPKDGTGTALAYTIMYLYTYYMYTNIHIYILVTYIEITDHVMAKFLVFSQFSEPLYAALMLLHDSRVWCSTACRMCTKNRSVAAWDM